MSTGVAAVGVVREERNRKLEADLCVCLALVPRTPGRASSRGSSNGGERAAAWWGPMRAPSGQLTRGTRLLQPGISRARADSPSSG